MCPRVVDVFPCQCHDHRRVLDNSAETVPTRRRYLVLSNVALNTRTPAIQHILPAVPSRTVNPTQMLVIKPISAPADPRAADRFDGHGCGDIHNEENDAWRDMDYARRRVATARWQGCGRLLPVQRTQDPAREMWADMRWRGKRRIIWSGVTDVDIDGRVGLIPARGGRGVASTIPARCVVIPKEGRQVDNHRSRFIQQLATIRGVPLEILTRLSDFQV